MLKDFFTFLMATIFLTNCSSKQTKNDSNSLEENLIGKWENISLHIEIKNDDKDSIIDVPIGQWEKVLRIKPIITEFGIDKQYISTYYNVNGDKIMTTSGNWYILNDSLVMENDGNFDTYHSRIKDDTVRYEAYLDWDNDGLKDDYYSSVQIKTSL